MKKKKNELQNQKCKLSEKSKDFINGIFYCIFIVFILIGFIPNEMNFQNIVKYQLILQKLGIAAIIFFIIFKIVDVFKSKKIDVGLFYIPIILIFVPIIAAELTNEYFIAFITCITIIFSILIINKIPVELKPKLIMEWKFANTIIGLIAVFFVFIFFIFPDTISNTAVEDIKEKIENAFFGSVFIYAVLKSSVEILEYRIKNLQSNNKGMKITNSMTTFNINEVITDLQSKRKLFVSEADFQLEIAMCIKERYRDAKVLLEYTPKFKPEMHIDILVLLNEEWIPIELKYVTKKLNKETQEKIFSSEYVWYNLKNHGAKDLRCYDYLKDIERIEEIKKTLQVDNDYKFKEGYTILITNDFGYIKEPNKIDCFYENYALSEGTEKHGELSWHKNTGKGTKKGRENSIELNGHYPINWKEYSKIDDFSSGIFYYLINKIE